jgi:2-polyprenyl-3-methyl-5-hydroxy-6-metoxy-1,4-benzoquinol methylase
MDKKDSDLANKIRQQFNTVPYPINPIEKSPSEEVICLYTHNIITPFYFKNQQVLETEGKVILDAGCGSGYTTLALAQANPGARVVGIDFSEESIDIARKRLDYHGCNSTEVHALSIEELPKLGKEFDYINCDEVLYLLPNPTLGLQAMKSVLKLDGIIRANLHSSLQRFPYYRAQKIFKLMGLMDGNLQDLEIDIAWETMRALKEQVLLKTQTWAPEYDKNKELTRVNHLLQGDKGYTIPEMFSALKAAGLEFISMVNWRQWELMDLFKDPENLPVFLGLSLPETSIEERLHLYELFNPVHRLLDFWCGHPNQGQALLPVAEWTLSDWKEAKVHLHPQLKTAAVEEELVRCITQLHPFAISKYLPIAGKQLTVESILAACLLPPLLESGQSMQSLVKRWQILRPIHPLTLKQTTEDEAMEVLSQTLTGLEDAGYVLLER